ncbi:hypothetical protein GV794_15620 [Nocardia cyriacigeorgica]|uniref:Uncharacterized protein n=1 Tax=Nocardia cyriacigeorgica TaxID=135487 RepID=A0A6P1DA12_9NOCA|nr:hypothetical protein [Nocardia cyriacigeorgica]NEW41939.1 hypothetical protein [Nocardia cyriacigeorgica]NEW46459.1 hypothetical protein [Nocardia cyriacigeorgica]NEW53031.1 hypothetical protein [Nocardia cyriacigeorgica]NEW57073.1 hypothetical protein [Nocardia cyriacigeorgica]
MSSVFAVLPAAATGSPERAFEQYEAILAGRESTVPLPVVGIVAAQLGRQGTPLSVARPADARGVLLRGESDDHLACLCAVLRLTATRDLAVFDVADGRLHDPRTGVRLSVTAGAHTFPALTESLVEILIPEDGDLDNPALTVAHSSASSIRTRQLPDGIYELTCHTGSDHVRLLTDDAPLARKAVWSWARRDPWWRQAIAWQPCEPPTAADHAPAVDEVAALRAELHELRAEAAELETLDVGAAMAELDALTQSVLDIDIPDLE